LRHSAAAAYLYTAERGTCGTEPSEPPFGRLDLGRDPPQLRTSHSGQLARPNAKWFRTNANVSP